MDIRKALLEDLDRLVPLFDQYRMFYQKESDLPGARDFLKERFMQHDSEIYVAINPNDKMTGFMQLYPLLSSTRMKRFWLLNDLFVHAAYRGQGISVLLIEEAKKLCRQSNSAGMMLETAKTNVQGNSLYPKTGFTQDAEHNFYYWDTI